MSRQRFPCRDRDGHDKRSGVVPFVLQQVWPWQGFLYRNRAFQVATKFCQGQEFLCRNRVFLCRDRVWSRLRVLCLDKIFYVMTELAKVKRIYVVTEYFCVATEFGLG